jgi:hypothetical protein
MRALGNTLTWFREITTTGAKSRKGTCPTKTLTPILSRDSAAMPASARAAMVAAVRQNTRAKVKPAIRVRDRPAAMVAGLRRHT